MKKKKYISLMVAAMLMLGSLSACGAANSSANNSNSNSIETSTTDSNSSTDKTSDAKDDSLEIVTTIFPEYDWVMNVLGDNPANADVTMLLDSGVDLHSFQPTTEDILKISTCDLFVYVGGESDGWVDDALAEATNEDMIVVNLLDVLGENVKAEEMVEGMQESEHHHDHGDEEHEHSEDEHEEEHDEAEAEEHDHDEAEAEEHDHDDAEAEEHEHAENEAEEHEHEAAGHEHEHEEGEVEYDEHVWLSLKNAVSLTESISEGLQKADPDHADAYATNAAAYIGKLNALDTEYQTAVSEASLKTLLFGDRFPFRYLVDDYGLSYYAAFIGCSAETEASFETITFLAGKVDELSLPAVMTIEGKDHRIAETIVANTTSKDQKILTMDSMQATTAEDVENGTTYLSIMENNLSVLKEALQ